jgi:hypothetical protein
VDFNTGHYDGDTYLDILEPFIVRIERELGLLVGVQTPPHRDLKRYDHLREICPKTEDMVPVFRRLYEAVMERGLPAGVAPNIHVSLVMLPEECRFLSPNRYPWQSLKLKAMATVFTRQFERRLARHVA